MDLAETMQDQAHLLQMLCPSHTCYFTNTVVLLSQGHPFKNSQVALQEEWSLMRSTTL